MKIKERLREVRKSFSVPARAKAEDRIDQAGLPEFDPGIEKAISTAIQWLCLAQDCSLSKDGGVARHFSLIDGWSTSYPETTGYIVPTLLAYANMKSDKVILQRAKRMLDWLVSIQFPEGGFKGGRIDAKPNLPVIFNTGQILLGLAAGAREFETYREAMCEAADWLVAAQDPDGCWRKYSTPFAAPGEKVYETHVAWGLFEAAYLEPDKSYADAALANVQWALKCQQENGWFDKCCLEDPLQPLTHTIGYVLRGLLEAYRFTSDAEILTACKKTADGLLTAIDMNGYLSGRLNSNWKGTVPWVCLTGSVQIAHCWLMLYHYVGNTQYRDAAISANRYVRRTMKTDGFPEICGAIKGSFPCSGGYLSYQFPNWACKFFIDSHLLELSIRKNDDIPSGI